MAERIVELEDALAASKKDADDGWSHASAQEVDATEWAHLWKGAHEWGVRRRLAWLSARRRAAHESDMAADAVAHLAADRDRWKRAAEQNGVLYAAAENQRDDARQETARFRSYAADVKAVRGWALDGSEDCPLRFLREVHESTHELETAEREGRPFVSRTHRRAARGDFDEVR
ncbi:hypothetical protein [Streptomyces sp. R44]|uniref:Uncharacterized protein n=1 Tax=Streptomyces sp. R44 TaxID=3238633 RepID=A0AB39T7J9_9ACTN